jgi:hypothetical protein
MPTVYGANLAFFLFLPVFVILGVLYCAYPRAPRGAARFIADIAVLIAAALLSLAAMRAAFAAADGVGGAIWKQVVATLIAYGAFLAVLIVAAIVRAKIFARRRVRAA